MRPLLATRRTARACVDASISGMSADPLLAASGSRFGSDPAASGAAQPGAWADSQIPALADQCVMCGLCLPHCPTYRISLDEAESPRGRIALARSLASGRIAPGPTALSHLDQCLTCLSCENVCPSEVRYGEIITRTRAALTGTRARRGALAPAGRAQPRGCPDAREPCRRGLRASPLHGAEAMSYGTTPTSTIRTWSRRRARKPTTWPGPRPAWTNWAPGPRCSIRSGTPAPSAWALLAGRFGDRGQPGLRDRDRAPGGGAIPETHLGAAACRRPPHLAGDRGRR